MHPHFAVETKNQLYFYKDISKHKLELFIREYGYFHTDCFEGFKSKDIVNYYERLTEIASRARRELTYGDFERFCKKFGMEQGSEERAYMFEMFSVFVAGEFNDV